MAAGAADLKVVAAVKAIGAAAVKAAAVKAAVAAGAADLKAKAAVAAVVAGVVDLKAAVAAGAAVKAAAVAAVEIGVVATPTRVRRKIPVIWVPLVRMTIPFHSNGAEPTGFKRGTLRLPTNHFIR